MGLFITVEGGEYTGKTSVVIPGLLKFFDWLSIPVESSREPGGTTQAELLRAKIFEKSKNGADSEELAILFNQARKHHLEEKIIPFLGSKKQLPKALIVDRYIDSTRVYQGLEGGVAMSKIIDLEKNYVGDFLPDITLILYFPADRFDSLFADRSAQQREKTTWDMDSLEKHKQRQSYYLQLPNIAIMQNEHRHFFTIDAGKRKTEVLRQCITAIAPHLYDKKYGLTPKIPNVEKLMLMLESEFLAKFDI